MQGRGLERMQEGGTEGCKRDWTRDAPDWALPAGQLKGLSC